MREFGVSPRDLPRLDLNDRGGLAASIEPRGLWIIGGNGRLDFVRNGDRYVVYDAAENFAPPSWQVAPFSDRTKFKPFDRRTFQQILS